MGTVTSIRIPVCNEEGVIVERCDPARARRLAAAPNATVVRKRVRGSLRRFGQRGEIVRIILDSAGDDSHQKRQHGNPRSYSHNHETDTNPENVWTLKRIPSESADIFTAVVDELAA